MIYGNLPDDCNLETAISEFWKLSTGFYQEAIVKQELLTLQNTESKNINHLLFAMWFSSWQGRRLKVIEIDSIERQCHQIIDWISRIRSIRKAHSATKDIQWSQQDSTIRKQLLASELAMEKKHQREIVVGLFAVKVENSGLSDGPLCSELTIIDNLELIAGKLSHSTGSYQLLAALWRKYISKKN